MNRDGIPIGALDRESRTTILDSYLSKLNFGQIDMDRLVERTASFTPVVIQHFFQQVAQFAFEQGRASGKYYLATAETFSLIKPKVLPSLSDEVIKRI